MDKFRLVLFAQRQRRPVMPRHRDAHRRVKPDRRRALELLAGCGAPMAKVRR
jgi:hypothetical protein